MHDLTAELTGYRNELASARRAGNDARAEAVAGEIDRVTAQLEDRAEQLLTEANDHDELGQHIAGAGKREEATRLRRALEADEPGRPAGETTTQHTPRGRATTRPRAARARRGAETTGAEQPATGDAATGTTPAEPGQDADGNTAAEGSH